jgi:cytochrome oxidase Cu insertion factor (SCO1/SenC/PrrC family)
MQRLLSMLLIAVGSAGVAHAHSVDVADRSDSPVPATPSATSAKQRAARMFFSDRKLLTQDGRTVAFYSDVLRDKVVLINFIFTQCTDSCPTQTARLAQVQPLVAHLGQGVSLVSISVDPENDSPAVLREYAARFEAREGWVFLTGAKRDIDDVLRRLQQLAPVREAHTTLFLLGNTRTGRWLKVHPDAPPDEIARQLHLLAAETGDGTVDERH